MVKCLKTTKFANIYLQIKTTVQQIALQYGGMRAMKDGRTEK